MDHVIVNKMKQMFVETCGEFMPNEHYIDKADAGEKSRKRYRELKDRRIKIGKRE